MKKKEPLEASSELLAPAIKEFFDGFILVGYSANGHQKVVLADPGKDPACRDGLEVMAGLSAKWKSGMLMYGSNEGPSRGGGYGPDKGKR